MLCQLITDYISVDSIIHVIIVAIEKISDHKILSEITQVKLYSSLQFNTNVLNYSKL